MARNGQMNQVRWLLERELAHVALAQLELDAGRVRLSTCDREHSRRDVDPDDAPAGLLDDGNRHTPRPDRKLDDGAGCLLREADVERDILRHGRGELVVDRGEGVVVAHSPDSSSLRASVSC